MSVALRFDALSENLRIAIDALRVSKMRSALTILGVVIGVATVMAMAAIVEGIRKQIVSTIEVAGPTTFYVMKKFSQTPLNPDNLPKDVRIRPDLSEQEAERIRRLPEIAYASLWAQVLSRIEVDGVRSQMMAVFGADDGFTLIQGGDLTTGRWFTRDELTKGGPVVVLEEGVARKLFGEERILGRWVRVGGRPLEVIGLYQMPSNIFAPPGSETGAIIPYRLMDHQFHIDRTNGLFIPVKPRAGVLVADAQGEVTMLLREMRGLRPGSGNTFDLITQDQILDTFNSITGMFFIVMMVLSGVSLLVGGIGVMAIMTVSVTSRTREIGVRKALGARRRDIMSQFLVEAATLSVVGAAVGIGLGIALAGIIAATTPLPAAVAPWSILAALTIGAGVGVVAGIYPASRASRLDPIAALRQE